MSLPLFRERSLDWMALQRNRQTFACEKVGSGASGRLPPFQLSWLQAVEVGDSALGVGSRLEDRPFVVGQHRQPTG